MSGQLEAFERAMRSDRSVVKTFTRSLVVAGAPVTYSVVACWPKDVLAFDACDRVHVAVRVATEPGVPPVRVTVAFDPGFPCVVERWDELAETPAGGSKVADRIEGVLADQGTVHAVVLRRAPGSGRFRKAIDLLRRAVEGGPPRRVAVSVAPHRPAT